MNQNIRILLVDDHELIRYGLRRMLEQEEDMEVVDDCASAEEAFPLVETLSPDIVLMDTLLPGMDGIEAIRHLKKNGVDYSGSVIILDECAYSRAEALKAGAACCLIKEKIKRAELTQAIRQVYWSKQSAEDREGFAEETVELIIPPPAEAKSAQLLRFLYQLEEILNDNYDSIMRVVGSWDRGTAITLTLRSTTLASLLNEIANMPNIKAVEEESPAKGAFSGLLKNFGVLPRSSISPSKKIRVTLKQTGMAKQRPATVLLT